MKKETWSWVFVGTLISWIIGWTGADRIYKGDILLGILKLVTFGGFGIWYLVDALLWTYALGHTTKK